jgi:hypothetical protein
MRRRSFPVDGFRGRELVAPMQCDVLVARRGIRLDVLPADGRPTGSWGKMRDRIQMLPRFSGPSSRNGRIPPGSTDPDFGSGNLPPWLVYGK